MRMCHIVFCGLSGTAIFFYINFIHGTILVERLMNTKCVFWFSLQICLKHFSFCKKSSEILLKTYKGLRIKYRLFLSDFNETWILSTDFRKKFKYWISWKFLQIELSFCMRTDRRINMSKWIVFVFCVGSAVTHQIYCSLSRLTVLTPL
jgi:hypothetical protein